MTSQLYILYPAKFLPIQKWITKKFQQCAEPRLSPFLGLEFYLVEWKDKKMVRKARTIGQIPIVNPGVKPGLRFDLLQKDDQKFLFFGISVRQPCYNNHPL
ncbi:unnamed protein product [Blepharisma stoltei]|uniref:Uncharacterized protein n=1 Tax=Blepharisma stoltei TaxID=1481888 RepID=A0AAU9KD08_9CILI|nr:unnamed protein product [Blepharisma stoltei]